MNPIEDFNDFIMKTQKHHAETNEIMREANKKNLVTPVPSAKDLMQCLGMDLARVSGLEEPYRDSYGINMLRDPDAWEKNWAHKYPDSEYINQ